VIGGDSAGLAAALTIREAGSTAAIVERESFLGGILMQCIHSGFGIHEFGEDLTGPEYAERFIGRNLDDPARAAGRRDPRRSSRAGQPHGGVDSMSARTEREGEMICIACPPGYRRTVAKTENGELRVSVNRCPKGEVYAREEILSPKRIVTAVVRTDSAAYPYVPVRPDTPSPC
jgi:hypothetical protein